MAHQLNIPSGALGYSHSPSGEPLVLLWKSTVASTVHSAKFYGDCVCDVKRGDSTIYDKVSRSYSVKTGGILYANWTDLDQVSNNDGEKKEKKDKKDKKDKDDKKDKKDKGDKKDKKDKDDKKDKKSDPATAAVFIRMTFPSSRVDKKSQHYVQNKEECGMFEAAKQSIKMAKKVKAALLGRKQVATLTSGTQKFIYLLPMPYFPQWFVDLHTGQHGEGQFRWVAVKELLKPILSEEGTPSVRVYDEDLRLALNDPETVDTREVQPLSLMFTSVLEDKTNIASLEKMLSIYVDPEHESDSESEVELVPAAKPQTLREALAGQMYACIYTCKGCRKPQFSEKDLEYHERFDVNAYVKNKSTIIYSKEERELIKKRKLQKQKMSMIKRELLRCQGGSDGSFAAEDQAGNEDDDGDDGDDDDFYFSEEDEATAYLDEDDEDYEYDEEEEPSMIVTRQLRKLEKLQWDIDDIARELSEGDHDRRTFLKPIFSGKQMYDAVQQKETPCNNYCLRPRDYASLKPLEGNEGDMECLQCNTRCGSYRWSGQQCSCGAWIIPSIQIPLNKIDRLVMHVPTGRSAPPQVLATYIAPGEKNMPLKRGVQR